LELCYADQAWSTSRTAAKVAVSVNSTVAAAAGRSATEAWPGRRASEIRDGSAEIASKVDLLRATLGRVIRTSTTDVDRRSSSRVDIRRPAAL
jgi:methyl-accepting chemotaxis protein